MFKRFVFKGLLTLSMPRQTFAFTPELCAPGGRPPIMVKNIRTELNLKYLIDKQIIKPSQRLLASANRLANHVLWKRLGLYPAVRMAGWGPVRRCACLCRRPTGFDIRMQGGLNAGMDDGLKRRCQDPAGDGIGQVGEKLPQQSRREGPAQIVHQ